jgi:hypothetical protein
VDFYLGDGITAVEEAHYAPLTEEDLQATLDIWDAGTTGTQVEG